MTTTSFDWKFYYFFVLFLFSSGVLFIILNNTPEENKNRTLLNNGGRWRFLIEIWFGIPVTPELPFIAFTMFIFPINSVWTPSFLTFSLLISSLFLWFAYLHTYIYTYIYSLSISNVIYCFINVYALHNWYIYFSIMSVRKMQLFTKTPKPIHLLRKI